MGAEGAIFVRRDGHIDMDVDGETITSVSIADHRRLVERAAAAIGLAVVPMWRAGIRKLDKAPLFYVELGEFICILHSEDEVYEFAGPPDFMVGGMYSGAVAYSGYVARLGANVVPFPKARKRKRH